MLKIPQPIENKHHKDNKLPFYMEIKALIVIVTPFCWTLQITTEYKLNIIIIIIWYPLFLIQKYHFLTIIWLVIFITKKIPDVSQILLAKIYIYNIKSTLPNIL
jgi:hypothetical protein